MKKNRKIIGAVCILLALSVMALASGCSQPEEPAQIEIENTQSPATPEPTKKPAPTATPKPTPEPAEPYLGEQIKLVVNDVLSQGEDAFTKAEIDALCSLSEDGGWAHLQTQSNGAKKAESQVFDINRPKDKFNAMALVGYVTIEDAQELFHMVNVELKLREKEATEDEEESARRTPQVAPMYEWAITNVYPQAKIVLDRYMVTRDLETGKITIAFREELTGTIVDEGILSALDGGKAEAEPVDVDEEQEPEKQE